LDYYLNKFYSVPNYRTALIAIFFSVVVQMIMPSWRLFFIGLAVHVLFSYTKNNRIDRAIDESLYSIYISYSGIDFYSVIDVVSPGILYDDLSWDMGKYYFHLRWNFIFFLFFIFRVFLRGAAD